MKQYLDLCRFILSDGERRSNRTGIDSVSYFCPPAMRFDLRDGLPILTTRRQYFSTAVKELLWMLRGETNIETLGSHIWDSWARPDGSIGPMYGHQLRKFNEEESAVRTSFEIGRAHV